MENMNKEIVKQLPLTVNFEFGRTKKTIEEIISFKKESVIKLESSKKDIIRIMVNDRMYAEGKALRKNGVMYVEVKEIKEKGE